MLTFLFWNLARKPLTASVVRLVNQHQADVLILAECTVLPVELLTALNPDDVATFHYAPQRLCTKIAIYYRFLPEHMSVPMAADDLRYTARHITLPQRESLLLFAVHLPDKRNNSPETQARYADRLSAHIRRTEDDIQHRRTVVVGDFNMSPFERGIISAYGLHAVMTRDTATQEKRTVQSEDYPFFYNPMWNHFGDANGRPAGTYYYRSSDPECYFWHMFDQVLLRPELLPWFEHEHLQILTSDGENVLTTRNGRPNSNRFSDHLPILFRLEI